MNALRIVLMVGCLVFGHVGSAATKINGSINFQGETVHLEMLGQTNWVYDLKRLDKKGQTIVEMTVDPLDDSSIQSLSQFKSEYVTAVSVNRDGPDGKHVIAFTLSGEDIETFDYLTDQPSRLIVDFYVNPAQSKVKKESVAKKPALTTTLPAKVAKKETAKDAVRKPATSDAIAVAPEGNLNAESTENRSGIFDGGDPNYDRFSIKDYEIKDDYVLRAKENYYIPFPMLETPVNFWEKLKASPTIYEISTKNTDENKQARLLLTLFEKGRYAVYLKTEQWFKEKYPKSEYSEVVDFMTADVYYNMWQEKNNANDYDKAIQKYKEGIQKYPNSPLTERTSLKIGFLALERGDNIAALRAFNEHIDNKNFGSGKNSVSKDLAHLGMGLAYMKMNKWDEAIAEYNLVEKTSSNRDLQVEAAYRRGDVMVRAKNFAKAVEEYRNALKKYPEGQNFYPNAVYNQAESLFGMKQYGPSMDVYRDFVKKFPTSAHAPFAMTRLGELLEIMGADKSRVIGAYLETYFRYGENPSAIIARLRLLSARMKGMKPKETANAVSEIMSLAKRVDLPNIEQFATVMVADGYTRRGEFQKSIDLLSTYYKEHPTSVDVPLVTKRIVNNINEKLQSEVEAGNFIQALKTHSKYSDSWLKGSPRLDTKFYVGKAFEMAGVPQESEKYYRDVLNRTYAVKGTQAGKELSFFEDLPSEDVLNLRLAAINTQEQKFNQGYEYLKNIKAPEKMSEVDQIERVNLAVKLLERRGDTDSAIRYLGELLKTWKGQPELVAEPYMKLAELQLKQGKSEDAIQALTAVDKLQVDSGKVSPVIHAKALETVGDIYFNKGDKDKAIQAYNHLLEKYEDKRPLASIRYKLGEIYFKRGEPQKAADIWNDLKGERSEFWKSLAQEQLKNSEWRDGYKKYIKRIPAMSENQESK